MMTIIMIYVIGVVCAYYSGKLIKYTEDKLNDKNFIWNWTWIRLFAIVSLLSWIWVMVVYIVLMPVVVLSSSKFRNMFKNVKPPRWL